LKQAISPVDQLLEDSDILEPAMQLNFRALRAVAKQTMPVSLGDQLIIDPTTSPELQIALRQADKMEVMEHIAGGFAHDFINRLQVVVCALDMLQVRIEQGRADEVANLVQTAAASLRRTATLTRSFLAFWRPQPFEVNLVSVNTVIASMESLVRCTLGEDVIVEFALTTGLPLVSCDDHQLENALLNLIVNAKDAMPHGGSLVIETLCVNQDGEEKNAPCGQLIGIRISDTGVGMTPDVVEHAFDPFYTTKPKGRGTGLGLAMVKCFVDRFAGQVRVRSAAGEGTTIALYLPTR